jgi:biopolymer transport protein ExbD
MPLTSPLGLIRHVRQPDLRLEVVPWLNVLLLGWMFTLFGPPFLYTPGLAVAVGKAPGDLPAGLDLPTAGDLPGTLTDETLVITKQNQFVIKDGIYDLAGLQRRFEDLRLHPSPRTGKTRTLLIKAEQGIPVETLAKVLEMAPAAGFPTVVIAVKGRPTVVSPTVP